MGFPRGNVPWAGFGAEPQYKSVGDTTKLWFTDIYCRSHKQSRLTKKEGTLCRNYASGA